MAKVSSTTKASRKPRDAFSLSRVGKARFKGEGLRPYFVYRDLGIKGSTGGRVGAHVIKAARACTEGTGRHRHGVAFQMVYILKGRARFWYEGEGAFELGPGDCVHQPPGILHELIESSDDLEMLEITLPAEFATDDAPKEAKRRAPAAARR
jgi:quercetin dioxygenase-like cupin family protein